MVILRICIDVYRDTSHLHLSPSERAARHPTLSAISLLLNYLRTCYLNPIHRCTGIDIITLLMFESEHKNDHKHVR